MDAFTTNLSHSPPFRIPTSHQNAVRPDRVVIDLTQLPDDEVSDHSMDKPVEIKSEKFRSDESERDESEDNKSESDESSGANLHKGDMGMMYAPDFILIDLTADEHKPPRQQLLNLNGYKFDGVVVGVPRKFKRMNMSVFHTQNHYSVDINSWSDPPQSSNNVNSSSDKAESSATFEANSVESPRSSGDELSLVSEHSSESSLDEDYMGRLKSVSKDSSVSSSVSDVRSSRKRTREERDSDVSTTDGSADNEPACKRCRSSHLLNYPAGPYWQKKTN